MIKNKTSKQNEPAKFLSSPAYGSLLPNEERYRTILDGIEDSYLEVDLGGNFQFFNRAFCKMLGYPENELKGRNNREFVDSRNAEKVFKIFNQVYRTGKAAKGVAWEFRRKDGSIKVIEATVSLVTDSRGEPIGFRGIGRDITELKKMLTSLRQAKEHNETILKSIQSGLIVIDAKTHTILDINPAAADMIGAKPEEILGSVCHRFLCPEAQGNCPLTEMGEMVNNTEALLLRTDGSQTEILKSVSRAILNERECFIESFIDISDRKRAEEAVQAYQERFRIFFSSLNDAIFVHPLQEKGFAPFIEVNNIACQRYGYSRDEFLKLTAQDITKKIDVEQHATPEHRKMLLETKHQVFEAIHIKKSGEAFPVEINANIVEQYGRPVIIAVVRDVTERKQAEQEKAKIETQYRQAQKVEAIGRLAGGVAHDLNNLLTPIIGYGELLLEGLGPDDERHEFLHQIVRAGNSAKDLVHQLLAFGRKQTLEYKTADLNEIVEAFNGLLKRTIREDIDIDVILAPDIPAIKADIGQIEQVIMNLSVNAQDAMPKGGRLTLKTGMAELDERDTAKRPGSRAGLYTKLTICDTGCGMDEKIQEQIFEPFYSTKGTQGTGLGLATVYGIVKQHGGNIWVESQPGKGTAFEVLLPASEDVPVEKHARKIPASGHKGSETILLVEDSDTVRLLSHRILDRLGYTILVAENGPEALKTLSSFDGSVDLLLTDVVMPDMNGKDLFAKVAEKYPNIRVLYMSGYTDSVIAHHGVLDDGVQLIQKPFSVEALSGKVREVLDRS
ncbi:PAS domain S-box protein [uncultured Desulfosarcina sp.]|uniref:hybrid sensor histidine kinase/response regulator n=1 Tax=uncultured Desulfosarcina sp. TaxID=218289 RepID=UPI0029C7CB6E|nr:PAS domain S-box protein [uncultured Desulfosarcina sp.]